MSSREFKLYDTLSRKVKPLATVEPAHLRFYSCGPTVYSYAHIGNFRTFLTADLVVRTAEALGWTVDFVSNITDVGHLTSDDVDAEGPSEDRMEKGLKSKEGERFRNVWDLAEYYADEFKLDWHRLNLKEPMVWPKATQHMREQILAVESLIEDNHAYETPTGVYFDVGSFKDYGKLSGNKDQDQLKRAVREIVTDDNKRHPADFALWKKDDKHLMQWFSPWGWGFPGWHLECSVMARQYLGDTLDLHAGGEDLVFPHHECEIAQSESITGKPFSNHWMHTRFLQVDGEKMSKSKGNFYTVRDLIEGKNADPIALRYALISVPYGKPLNFTLQTLEDATKAVERYRECERLARAAAESNRVGGDSIGEELRALYSDTLDAMCDDLNTSVALAKAYEGTKVILRQSTLNAAEGRSALEFIGNVNALLGIVYSDYAPQSDLAAAGPKKASGPIGDTIHQMVMDRIAAKKGKDFQSADAIRAQLEGMGVEMRDAPGEVMYRLKGDPEWIVVTVD